MAVCCAFLGRIRRLRTSSAAWPGLCAAGLALILQTAHGQQLSGVYPAKAQFAFESSSSSRSSSSKHALPDPGASNRCLACHGSANGARTCACTLRGVGVRALPPSHLYLRNVLHLSTCICVRRRKQELQLAARHCIGSVVAIVTVVA